MRRRDFIATLGSVAAWPLSALAQQPAMPVIGVLSPGAPELRAIPLASIRSGLAEAGFVEGRNITIEYRWAGDDLERLEVLAAELVRREVRVIIALGGERGALAAKAATSSVPIVFNISGDPVEMGLVKSLNRPGGNLTGGTALSVDVTAKRVELLHELLPAANLIGLLVDKTYPGEANAQTAEAERAARILGLRLLVLTAHDASEFETAFAAMARERLDGLVVSGGATTVIESNRIVALSTRHAIPTLYPYRESALAGGLMSYGTRIADLWVLAGAYAGRIIKGEKPADLPVQQATRFDLTINMKTARALRISFPLTLLGRADEVIE
jgi:putative ABC transport system substrate-binding protein